MRWLELGLRAVLAVSLLGLILLYDPTALPIVELALAIIIVSVYLFVSLPDPDQTERPDDQASIGRITGWGIMYSLAILTVTLVLPLSFFFWPLYAYQWTMNKTRQLVFILVAPLIIGFLLGYPFYLSLAIAGLGLLASWFHTSLEQSRKFEQASYEEIDTLRYLNERFRAEQDSLIQLQDDRVHESIKQERRRIVEEIHDALGHQLSSAVIQIGALEYLAEAGDVKVALKSVKHVLTSSMDNVREIIHTERQTTIDVEQELQSLVANFTKCPINFTYNNNQPMSSHVAHSVVNIVKEALTNINKHSNATLVNVRLINLKKQWTLLLADNGDQLDQTPAATRTSSTGIGLLNIEERVNKMAGTLHINHQNGFRLFITIPIQLEEEN